LIDQTWKPPTNSLSDPRQATVSTLELLRCFFWHIHWICGHLCAFDPFPQAPEAKFAFLAPLIVPALKVAAGSLISKGIGKLTGKK
jgi:hypothetical protein